MPTVADAIKLMRNIAPEEYAYKDGIENVGLIVGRLDAKVNKIMCCLDVSSRVIDEALEAGANLIISHHPLIFLPVSSISCETVLGQKLLRLAENKIAVYASHTNLDFVADGINDFVAERIGLKESKPLDAYISDDAGLGRIGDLSGKIPASQLRDKVGLLLNDKFVRIIGDRAAQVRRIAVINGAGGGDTKYIDLAREAGADCLVTADVKHHVAVYALDCGLTLIEPQHHTMEHCYIQRLVQLLKLEVKAHKLDVEVIQSAREAGIRN